MALSESEELELLELEEAEAHAKGQTAPTPQPTPEKTGLDKAVDVSNAVTGTLGKIASPVTKPIGRILAAVKKASDDAADKEAELSGQHGRLPISAMVPAIPSMLIDALGVPDRAGEYIAEKGGKMGYPKTAAALGTAVSVAPDVALGAEGIAKRALIAKSLEGAAKSAGNAASKYSGFDLAKDLVTKPGAAEVTQAGKEALVGIGEHGAQKLDLARQTRDAAKKGLIEAEEGAGLHFQSTPGFEEIVSNPKKMADFTERIGRLAKHTPEELAQLVPSEQLQLFRKIAQEGEKMGGLSDIAKSQLRQGKDVFTQALGKVEPKIGESLQNFRDADKVVGEIPNEIKNKLNARKLQNSRDVLDAKTLDRKRKVVKGLAGAAAGYLGLKSIFK